MKLKKPNGLTDCTLQDIMFPVEMIDNPRPANREYSKIVIGHLESGDLDVNYCSPRYELVPNADIFPKIMAILMTHKISYEVNFSHDDHARFYADFQITDKRYAYHMKGTNDAVTPMLRVQHSYNGITKYRIVFGYFRLVCTNGLTIAIADMNKFNLVLTGKHTASIQNSLQRLNELMEVFANDAKQITEALTATYEILGGSWVENPADRIAEVLAASKIAAIDNSKFNTVQHILDNVLAESNGQRKIGETPLTGYNGKVNDWLIYNGINQYINDDSLNIAAPEKRMENDSKVFEYLLKHPILEEV
ncbi:MAG TPA: DUF932 domain-containing protein [Lentimicrobium sp.]|nr:DUF932 domain-containing protein [Lentimicrobium sp.]